MHIQTYDDIKYNQNPIFNLNILCLVRVFTLSEANGRMGHHTTLPHTQTHTQEKKRHKCITQNDSYNVVTSCSARVVDYLPPYFILHHFHQKYNNNNNNNNILCPTVASIKLLRKTFPSRLCTYVDSRCAFPECVINLLY